MNTLSIFFIIILSSFLVQAGPIPSFPDFNTSMAINGKTHTFQSTDLRTQLIKHLYENFVSSAPALQKEQRIRIPKIIHQIWLGKKMPEQYRIWAQTFVEKNPDWQYILWDEKALRELGLTNQKLFDVAEKNAFKADIARYEVLYRFGGIYFDADFECIRSFDFLSYCCDFFSACDPDARRIQICAFGSCPGHPVLQKCIDTLSKVPISKKAVDARWQQTGPDLLTKCFYDFAFSTQGDSNNIMVIFPSTFFFPLPKYERFAKASSEHPKIKKKIKPETLGIHYWHNSWIRETSMVPK